MIYDARKAKGLGTDYDWWPLVDDPEMGEFQSPANEKQRIFLEREVH